VKDICNKCFFSRIDTKASTPDVVVLQWCSEYVIPKEGPGTARDEGGTNERRLPKSACAGDTVLRTRQRTASHSAHFYK
jgi:hypothetical protein